MESNNRSGRSVAVLVGNGLSVSCSEKLKLDNLTAEAYTALKTEQGDEVSKALWELAEAIEREEYNGNDFESVIGALEDVIGYLRSSESIVKTVADQRAQDPIDIGAVVAIYREAYLIAACHVLERARVASASKHELEEEHLREIVSELHSSNAEYVTFFNLNYDTLLYRIMSDMLSDGFSFYDLANGRGKRIKIGKLDFIPLRSSVKDLHEIQADYRVGLIHLHGSLAFWRKGEMDSSDVYKAQSVKDLDDDLWWKNVRGGAEDYYPAVVLSNVRNKSKHLGTQPFQLAYEFLEDQLTESKQWLIIGYSFRDEGVNQLLRRCFDFKWRSNDLPTVLVCDTNAAIRTKVEEIFGWIPDIDGPSETWLSICFAGAKQLVGSAEWRSFKETL